MRLAGRDLTFNRLEAQGAFADLGTFLPLVAALVAINGLDPGAIFVAAGLVAIGANLYFGVPVPVQPLKAMTAIAVARALPPEVIVAAALCMAAILAVLRLGRLADLVARVFTEPIVRGLQLGVGLLLLRTAWTLAVKDQARPALALAVGIGAALVVLAATRWHRIPLALLLLAGAVAVGQALGGPGVSLVPHLWHPHALIPPAAAFPTALLVLVLPQIPLTFGNAVVAVSHMERDFFGERAWRVRPSRVCMSMAIGDVIAGGLGGIPLCHGAGGLTAHYRLGARTAGMGVILGGAFLTVGLLFSRSALGLIALLPLPVLAGFLAYTAVSHASLVRHVRGSGLAVSLAMGTIGVATLNLAWATAAGLALAHVPRLISWSRGLRTAAGLPREAAAE